MPRRRFTRERSGRFRVRLQNPERELLAALPGQALGVLDPDQPVAARLFPTAYVEDVKAESDYRELVGAELVKAHRESLEMLGATVEADSLSEAELHQWLHALEVLRLVLGTGLDVSEGDTEAATLDPEDPQAAQLALYHYLSAVQDDAVTALGTLLPDEGSET
jgi:hypothetical protein